MRIYYLTEKGNSLYDSITIQKILGVNKSKLHRELKKLPIKEPVVKFKNQFLYNERVLFFLMSELLNQSLDKNEELQNEL